MPEVSVIVPNYNYGQYLSERMESILNQSFQDFEVIILDDCSTDDSRDVIESYRSHPKVSHVVYNDINTGSPFKQWSKGISMAKGRYIWIAEADDVADVNFLTHTVSVLNSHPEVSAAYTLSRLIDTHGNEIPNGIEKTVYAPGKVPSDNGETMVYDGKSFFATRLIAHNVIYNASMVLFRADTYHGMDVRLYESMRYIGDWAFWSEMALHGDIAEVRIRLNSFRQHISSTTKQSLTDHREKLMKEEQQFGKFFLPIATDILSEYDKPYRRCPSYREYLHRYGPAKHKKRRYIKHLISSAGRAFTGRKPPMPKLSYLLSHSQPIIKDIIDSSSSLQSQKQ